MSLENLITDRTAQDIDRVNELAAKAWQDMTADERAEWMSPMKGSYNHTDLNRVEEAVAFIATELKKYGYLGRDIAVRTWSSNEIPTAEDLGRYFGNVATLRNAITVWSSTPTAPSVMNGFDVNKANALEKILLDIDQIINLMKDAWFYSGDLYSAEV